MSVRLAYANHEQLAYEREMERERAKYIGEGRCYDCDRIVTGEAGGTLGGMLICVECAGRLDAELGPVVTPER